MASIRLISSGRVVATASGDTARPNLGWLIRNGRPPTRLSEKSAPSGLRQNPKNPMALDGDLSKPIDSHIGSSSGSASLLARSSLSARALCREAMDSDAEQPRLALALSFGYTAEKHEIQFRQKRMRLLREAAAVARTPDEFAFVLTHIAHLLSQAPSVATTAALSQQQKHLPLVEEGSFGFSAIQQYVELSHSLAHRLSTSPKARPRDLCLGASALAQARLWHTRLAVRLLGDSLEERGSAARQPDTGVARLCQECNGVDLVQLCHFAAVFQAQLREVGFQSETLLESVLQRFVELEEFGETLEPVGLSSLLRSVVRMTEIATGPNGTRDMVRAKLGLWLRSHMVRVLPKCAPRHLAWMVHDFHSLDLLDSDTLMQLRREIRRAADARKLSARDLAVILSGFARLESNTEEARQMMKPLLPHILSDMPRASGTDLCELLHSVTIVHLRDSALLGAWAAHFCASIACVRPGQLALCAADLAKLRYVHDSLGTFDRVLNSIAGVTTALNGLEVYQVVTAMSRVAGLGFADGSPADTHRSLLFRLEEQFLRRAHELVPQGLSSTAAAFTKLRHFSENLFNCLADASRPRLAAFVPEDFAMLAYALSETHMVLPGSAWRGAPLEDFGRQAALSLERTEAWSPRQVGEVLQPFAVLRFKSWNLLEAATLHLRGRAADYSPRDLLRVMGGFRDCGYIGVPQIAQLWRVAEFRLKLFRGEQSIALAESLAEFREGLPRPELVRRFKLLSNTIHRGLSSLPHTALAAVVCLWARVGIRNWHLLSAVAGAASARIEGDSAPEIIPDDLSRMVYAYAKLGAPGAIPTHFQPPVNHFSGLAFGFFRAPGALSWLDERGLRRLLLGMVMPCIESYKIDVTPHAEDSLIHVNATAVLPRSAAWRCLLVEALVAVLESPDNSQFPMSRLRTSPEAQLRLVVASAGLEHGVTAADLGSPLAARRFEELLAEPVVVPPPRSERRRRSALKAEGELRSDERSVCKALTRLLDEWPKAGELGGPPLAEPAVLYPLSACQIRIAVPQWRVAVEVGSSNDLGGHGGVPTEGSSFELSAEEVVKWQPLPALRVRLLRLLGWHVIEIPYYEWRRLTDGLDQRQFLRGHLLAIASDAAAKASASAAGVDSEQVSASKDQRTL